MRSEPDRLKQRETGAGISALAMLRLGSAACICTARDLAPVARVLPSAMWAPRTKARTSSTPQQYVTGGSPKQASRELASLKAHGYRGAVTEQLGEKGGGSDAAISVVVALSSPATAQEEQADLLRVARSNQNAGVAIKRFTVAGVPGAEGFTAATSSGGAANAVFVEGSCVMLIGDYKPQGELRGPVAHAVAAVYHRTHGTCTS